MKRTLQYLAFRSLTFILNHFPFKRNNRWGLHY